MKVFVVFFFVVLVEIGVERVVGCFCGVMLVYDVVFFWVVGC